MFQTLGVDIPLETVRHQVIIIRRPEDILPDHPIVGDVVNLTSFRPDIGNLTQIGYGEDEKVEPEGYNQGVDMPVAQEAFSLLVRRMPAAAQGFLRGGWSGLFTVTPDWHPILDKVDGVEGLYCAVGFSSHGFKLSPMIGVTMAELILEGKAQTIDISPLGMDRFKEGKTLRSRYSYSVLA